MTTAINGADQSSNVIYSELLQKLLDLKPFIHRDIDRHLMIFSWQRYPKVKPTSTYSLADLSSLSLPLQNQSFSDFEWKRIGHENKVKAIKEVLIEVGYKYIFPYLGTLSTDFERRYTFCLLTDSLINYSNEEQKEKVYEELNIIYEQWNSDIQKTESITSENIVG